MADLLPGMVAIDRISRYVANSKRSNADVAFDTWLETGHYASRPPGELHGPFKTDTGCIVLEISFPDKIQK